MKKTLLTLAITLFTVAAFAQAPNGFNYQGVVRDVTGAPFSNKAINLRLTIHDATATGTVNYQEWFNVTTNSFGLYNVIVGTGTVLFSSSIPPHPKFYVQDWPAHPQFMQVEVDLTATGGSYTDLGSAQLMSVPYALFAANGPTGAQGLPGPAGPAGATGATGPAGPIGPMRPGVDSVTAGAGLSGGTITTWGTISMPNVGTAGTYGSATTVPQITTDPQGRVSSVTNVPILGDNWGAQVVQVASPVIIGDGTPSNPINLGQNGAALGQIMRWNGTSWAPGSVGGTGTVTSITTTLPISGGPITSAGNISLANSGVAPGVYGSALGATVPVITVDAHGLITSASNAIPTLAGDATGPIGTTKVVALQGTSVSATPPTLNQVLEYTGTSWTPTTPTPGFTSTGTANYIPVFTSPTSVANSKLYEDPTSFMVGLSTTTPKASFHIITKDSMTGWFSTAVATPPVKHGIVEMDYAGTANSGTALQANAYNVASNNNTWGVEALGTAVGADAQGISTLVSGTASVRGLDASGYGNDQYSMGIGAYGNANGGAPLTSYGIVGNATGGGTNWSGYFVGNVNIGGNLTVVGTKSFRIDHPQDPDNKYLYHSCIESNEMMNMYNGNITTDATGVATVTLPGYFEALNKDFRYQLTVIGTFAQAIVSKEVSHNTFEIKTSVPNVKVSWQVTGIRNDATAIAHPMVAEVDKNHSIRAST